MSQSRIVVLVLLVGTLTVAGCGKSAENKSPATASAKTEISTGPTAATTVATGPPLTHAAFVSRADAVCKRLGRRRGTLTIKTRQDLANLGAKEEAVEATALTGLSKLVPPPALAGEWGQTMAAVRTLLADDAVLYERLQQTGSFSSASAKAALAQAEAARRRARAAARRLGLKECAVTL